MLPPLVPNQNSSDPSASALLVTRDLFFSSKITGTASALGFQVFVEGDATEAVSKAIASKCCCLILDLSLPGLDVAGVINDLPKTGRPAVIAFGAHVETERLQAARDAGCDEVLPRSKLSATLPEVLTRYLHA